MAPYRVFPEKAIRDRKARCAKLRVPTSWDSRAAEGNRQASPSAHLHARGWGAQPFLSSTSGQAALKTALAALTVLLKPPHKVADKLLGLYCPDHKGVGLPSMLEVVAGEERQMVGREGR